MPGFVIHIAIGEEYLRKHNLNYSKEFIKGTVAPDFTDDKSKTHYGKSPRYTNLKKFLENNKNVILIDDVKDKVFFKEGTSKTLTLELACKIIDEISSMDLKEIEAEVNKNLSKWNYYKNDT